MQYIALISIILLLLHSTRTLEGLIVLPNDIIMLIKKKKDIDYLAPEVKVIEIKVRRILCQSPGEKDAALGSTEMRSAEW